MTEDRLGAPKEERGGSPRILWNVTEDRLGAPKEERGGSPKKSGEEPVECDGG